VAVLTSVVAYEPFLLFASRANAALLAQADWLFTYASFAAVCLVAAIGVSPLGKVRIGGEGAEPILSRWNWFAITLCTTVAVGILFWGTAEPMFHLTNPPAFTGAPPGSDEAARFALASVFLHWTFTPYSIYAIPALAFALSHFNRGEPYSFEGPFAAVTRNRFRKAGGQLLDGAALLALVAGVAAALGAGVMSIAGGLEALAGIKDTTLSRVLITFVIVLAFIVSSLSGLQRGVKILSDLNIRIFFALAIFILIAGPTGAIIARGIDGLGLYGRDFIGASLSLGARNDEPWTQNWTVYFFANWLAWAPVTAMFLGRISVGYTVREFILFNVVLPAIFGIAWMTIFGAAAIELDATSGGTISASLREGGPDMVTYALLELLPFFGIAAAVFLVTIFISFVTAMDSNTLSISSLCIRTSQSKPAGTGQANAIKLFWGVLIGLLSVIMTATSGIDGVRTLSNLGGVPGLIILAISFGALLVILFEGKAGRPGPSLTQNPAVISPLAQGSPARADDAEPARAPHPPSKSSETRLSDPGKADQ